MDFDQFMLQHAATPYDAAARRERYLRTRQLKGRQKTASVTTIGRARKVAASPPKMKSGGGQQAEIQALEARLDELKDRLSDLVEAAKKRSGIETKAEKKSAKKEASKPDKPEKPMTAAQKKAQAERAKERRQDEKKGQSEKEAPSDTIAQLREQIADYREKIAKALADAQKPKTNRKETVK